MYKSNFFLLISGLRQINLDCAEYIVLRNHSSSLRLLAIIWGILTVPSLSGRSSGCFVCLYILISTESTSFSLLVYSTTSFEARFGTSRLCAYLLGQPAGRLDLFMFWCETEYEILFRNSDDNPCIYWGNHRSFFFQISGSKFHIQFDSDFLFLCISSKFQKYWYETLYLDCFD